MWTKKVIITWVPNLPVNEIVRGEIHDYKIIKVSEGKTDGNSYNTDQPNKKETLWLDAQSAQDYIDFLTSLQLEPYIISMIIADN